MKYASFGFQIEHLNERPGISSPDVNVIRHGGGDSRVKGRFGDFKSTISANNIVEYAKHAVKEQGADFLLIEFVAYDRKIPAKIKEMVRNNIHGYYYVSNEKGYHSF